MSKVLDVAASSAHEESLDSDKEGVASATQEISDTDSESQDDDAEELWQTSEGARVQLGLKCLCVCKVLMAVCIVPAARACKTQVISEAAHDGCAWHHSVSRKSHFEILCSAAEVGC